MSTIAASMEPPPFGGGNGKTPTHSGRYARCFNGATPFRRWKLANGRSL